jgi:hypothetical protein
MTRTRQFSHDVQQRIIERNPAALPRNTRVKAIQIEIAPYHLKESDALILGFLAVIFAACTVSGLGNFLRYAISICS